MPRSSTARRLASKAAGGLGRLVLIAAVGVLAATFVPSLLGYHRYVLVGHSMEPTIHKGSLVFDEIVPVAALRKGDVITYIPPITKEPVTHRILSIERGPNGERVFRTKGDNNPSPDCAASRSASPRRRA
jgi:signal peptidase